MADYFLGEVRAFSFAFAPADWSLCNGALMNVQQQQALYSLLGVQFGGSAGVNFNLPDLRGRTYYGQGKSVSGTTTYQIGNTAGAETVVLTAATMPAHSHDVGAYNGAGAAVNPKNTIYGQAPAGTNIYAAAAKDMIAINPASVETLGGGGAHPNMQPFAVVNFCISNVGIYPPRQ